MRFKGLIIYKTTKLFKANPKLTVKINCKINLNSFYS